MPKKVIRLEYPAVCADCGKKLHAGAKARYYGRGKVYGTECHPDPRAASEPPAPTTPLLRDPGEDAADLWTATHY